MGAEHTIARLWTSNTFSCMQARNLLLGVGDLHDPTSTKATATTRPARSSIRHAAAAEHNALATQIAQPQAWRTKQEVSRGGSMMKLEAAGCRLRPGHPAHQPAKDRARATKIVLGESGEPVNR